MSPKPAVRPIFDRGAVRFIIGLLTGGGGIAGARAAYETIHDKPETAPPVDLESLRTSLHREVRDSSKAVADRLGQMDNRLGKVEANQITQASLQAQVGGDIRYLGDKVNDLSGAVRDLEKSHWQAAVGPAKGSGLAQEP